jgi:hypothetical protein
MNTRLVFSRHLWLLFGIILISSFYLPMRYGISYPQTPGPQFSPQVKKEYIEAVSAKSPDLMIIGDSVSEGVDADVLAKRFNLKTYRLSIPGSGSAVWYLTIKNVIPASSHPPKYLVIVFRDTLLTVPSYRTTGRYFGLVDDFAGRREPLVTQLAYINQMSPLEQMAEQYFPLYSVRLKIRDGMDQRVRYTAPAMLFNCSIECTDEAINSIFGKERVDVVALNQAVEDAGQTLYAPAMLDFDGQVDRSFLPAMLELAKENNITLIFVRTKTLIFPEYTSEPFALRSYIQSLNSYVTQRGAYFLDFAHDARIKDTYFSDGLHFNAKGKEVFTQILANKLEPLLK